MRNILLLILAASAAACVSPLGVSPADVQTTNDQTEEVAMSFTLTSPAFKNGAVIPAEYSCRGRDISPALAWSEPPAGTQSFALIMDDPDAPMGTWVHMGSSSTSPPRAAD